MNLLALFHFRTLQPAPISTSACKTRVSDLIDGRIELRTQPARPHAPDNYSGYVFCHGGRAMHGFCRLFEDRLGGGRNLRGGGVGGQPLYDELRLRLQRKASRRRWELEVRDGHLRSNNARHKKRSTRSPLHIRAPRANIDGIHSDLSHKTSIQYFF